MGSPEPPKRSRNPDLYLGTPENGGYVDVLCAEAQPDIPTRRRAEQILDKAVEKVDEGQTQRVFIDLNRPGQNLTTGDLRTAWEAGYQREADAGHIYHSRQSDGAQHPLLEVTVYEGNRLTYLYPPYDQEPG